VPCQQCPESGRRFPLLDYDGGDRRHAGRIQIEQVALVAVPANHLDRVDHPGARLDPVQPGAKFIQSLEVIPGLPDHDGVEAVPVDFRVGPIHARNLDSSGGESFRQNSILFENVAAIGSLLFENVAAIGSLFRRIDPAVVVDQGDVLFH